MSGSQEFKIKSLPNSTFKKLIHFFDALESLASKDQSPYIPLDLIIESRKHLSDIIDYVTKQEVLADELLAELTKQKAKVNKLETNNPSIIDV